MKNMIGVTLTGEHTPQIKSIELSSDKILYIEHRSDRTVRICFGENVNLVLSEYDWTRRYK